MGYANLDYVKRKLLMTGAVNDPDLAVLDVALSALFDEATGRTFVAAAVEETITVEAPGVSSVLVLPKPVRSISAIETGGTWNGLLWQDATLIAADAERLIYGSDEQGYWAVRGVSTWSGPVRVTGVFADITVAALMPPDVIYAVTYAVIRQWRREFAGNDGQIGPDGLAVTVGEATANPIWKETVAKYRVPREVVV